MALKKWIAEYEVDGSGTVRLECCWEVFPAAGA